MQSGLTPASHRVTKRQEAAFAGKQSLLRVKRWAQDRRQGLRRYSKSAISSSLAVLAESRSPLWTEVELSERRMQLGKVQNLRVAIRQLDGILIPAGEIFSFWKQIGRACRRRGFVQGRELRGGCLIPTVGGGLCQLSNALCELALETGCEIVERHGHSVSVPGSTSKSGRDATVAWNYVDLRFRPKAELLIHARMDADSLIVQFLGTQTIPEKSRRAPESSLRVLNKMGSCVSCDEADCSRHRSDLGVAPDEPKALLLNGKSPEFLQFLKDYSSAKDTLCIPIDGSRFRLNRYSWPVRSFENVSTATVQVLKKVINARMKRARTPAEARAAQFAADETIAIALAKHLKAEHSQVVVAQSLLPYLWRDGALAGRRFDVLMERLPLLELQRRLDEAMERFPEQKLLGDFRVDVKLVQFEADALNAADHIVTPHSGIAKLFEGRARQLSWGFAPPQKRVDRRRDAIAFPGPTAARKGAYAVRDAARRMKCRVYLLGKDLEGSEFWSGVEVLRCTAADESWIENCCAVVQPSISEDLPYVLLQAMAAGIPIVMCDMHGLPSDSGNTIVRFGDVDAIVRAVESLR